MGKQKTRKQSARTALAAGIKEMAKPRMTRSAREQTEIGAGALVVQYDTDQGTVDVHTPAVVRDKAQLPKAI